MKSMLLQHVYEAQAARRAASSHVSRPSRTNKKEDLYPKHSQHSYCPARCDPSLSARQFTALCIFTERLRNRRASKSWSKTALPTESEDMSLSIYIYVYRYLYMYIPIIYIVQYIRLCTYKMYMYLYMYIYLRYEPGPADSYKYDTTLGCTLMHGLLRTPEKSDVKLDQRATERSWRPSYCLGLRFGSGREMRQRPTRSPSLHTLCRVLKVVPCLRFDKFALSKTTWDPGTKY